jgi:hypothetical protein
MGRGRAKAKQTKVARQLKYTTTATDLDRLRAELAADRGEPLGDGHSDEEEIDDYAEGYDVDDEDE